jgi:hypothetical protein
MCKKFFLSNPIRSFLNLSKEKVTDSIGGFESKKQAKDTPKSTFLSQNEDKPTRYQKSMSAIG